jgi:hypothetical protein
MKTFFILVVAAIVAVTLLPTITSLAPTASACQTNANGCIKNGGPGNSVTTPPEVSGCHFFDTQQCVRESTPP